MSFFKRLFGGSRGQTPAPSAYVDPKTSKGNTALMKAVCDSDIDSVRALIAGGTDSEWHYRTALMHAVRDRRPSLECVNALITAGADVNARSRLGDTALMYATTSTDCVKALIAAGADVNAKTGKGWTALLSAVSKGNTDCVKALIAAGADINAQDDEGGTAFTWAKDHPEIIAALKLSGAVSGGVSPCGECGGDWRGILECPSCAAKVSFPVAYLHKNSQINVTCPRCNTTVTIPNSVLCGRCGKGLLRGWHSQIVITS